MPIRVGVYVDALNLYNGGLDLVNKQTVPGWRWLDIRSLATSLLGQRWQGSTIARIVYCTARISGNYNPQGRRDQDNYLSALLATGSVDVIEEGRFVGRAQPLPVADKPRDVGRQLTSQWPLKVKDGSGNNVPDATYMVSVLKREEKGTDVNFATHLMIDTLTKSIDAAMVISNDSDLKMPVMEARNRIPVGTVNPRNRPTAGDLQGEPTDGVGNHWWYKLKLTDFQTNQLDNPAKGISKPAGW